ncbi:hypothetical protein EI94DRAFT_1699338 [Lactarius quietus]|nr:hypothetical protein EI94DRAFT_1699338 [Lactarius quietus]
MLHIIEDPNQAICPNFGGPQWEFLRQSMIGAHQGNQPLTPEDVAQQMKDAWMCEYEPVIAAWNAQFKVAQEEEARLRAQQEGEVEELCWEIKKKKPKLTTFDWSHTGPVWIEPRPAQYTLNKIDNLEYVELDYFTIKRCREAVTDKRNQAGDDSLGLAQHGDTIALRPLTAQRPTRCIRKDEELTWEEMLDAKNMMLQFMEKSGVWPALHAKAISGFFLNLKLHLRNLLPNGKRALLLYQS